MGLKRGVLYVALAIGIVPGAVCLSLVTNGIIGWLNLTDMGQVVVGLSGIFVLGALGVPIFLKIKRMK